MWGSGYLPMFLFRVGSFTLKNIASLLVLIGFCVSLLTIFINWRRGFKVFLKISLNVLVGMPKYSLSHSILQHLYPYITPLFCVIVSLSLGDTWRFLMVLKYTFEVYFYPIFVAHVLEAFTELFNKRYYHVHVALLIVIWFVVIVHGVVFVVV